MQKVSEKDKDRLRELARHIREIACSESMANTIRLWKGHNACRGERPMIRVELDTFANEIIPPLQQCEGEEARRLEWQLLSRYINPTLFGDDSVVRDFFPLKEIMFFRAFDIETRIEFAEDGIGRHFIPVVEDLETDFYKIKPSSFGLDREATGKEFDFISDCIGDILPVRLVGTSMYTVLTQAIVRVMGMENMYMAMVGAPELFVKMIDGLADDFIRFYNYLCKEGALFPTVEDEDLGQGTYCFTNELPCSVPPGSALTPADLWGFADSQETVGVSEAMYREMVFPAYKKVMSLYGLLSYGCCEPIHGIWDSCLSTLPNLRKVSISPWCHERFMGERLAGTNIVYHRKPRATYLGYGANMDEDGLRADIRNTLDCAKGCTIEFTQRDVYTVNHDISRVKRYVDIVREEILKSV